MRRLKRFPFCYWQKLSIGALYQNPDVADPAMRTGSCPSPGRLLARLVWRDNPLHVLTYRMGQQWRRVGTAAFAHEVTAHPKAWTQLPEIRWGLSLAREGR